MSKTLLIHLVGVTARSRRLLIELTFLGAATAALQQIILVPSQSGPIAFVYCFGFNRFRRQML
jgi:hypothetical protein